MVVSKDKAAALPMKEYVTYAGKLLEKRGGVSGRLSIGPGLGYRKSKSFYDRVPCDPFVAWGATVHGVDLKDGWLKVGDLYLPMVVDGEPVVESTEQVFGSIEPGECLTHTVCEEEQLARVEEMRQAAAWEEAGGENKEKRSRQLQLMVDKLRRTKRRRKEALETGSQSGSSGSADKGGEDSSEQAKAPDSSKKPEAEKKAPTLKKAEERQAPPKKRAYVRRALPVAEDMSKVDSKESGTDALKRKKHHCAMIQFITAAQHFLRPLPKPFVLHNLPADIELRLDVLMRRAAPVKTAAKNMPDRANNSKRLLTEILRQLEGLQQMFREAPDKLYRTDPQKLLERRKIKGPGIGPGLGYRKSKNFEDRAPSDPFVAWGAAVRGVDCGDGWLKVGDKLFLPTVVDNVSVVEAMMRKVPTATGTGKRGRPPKNRDLTVATNTNTS